MMGIVGKNCETNINECDSNPCSKHGTCVDGVSTQLGSNIIFSEVIGLTVFRILG